MQNRLRILEPNLGFSLKKVHPKSLKGQTKTCLGQANGYLSHGQAGM